MLFVTNAVVCQTILEEGWFFSNLAVPLALSGKKMVCSKRHFDVSHSEIIFQ